MKLNVILTFKKKKKLEDGMSQLLALISTLEI